MLIRGGANCHRSCSGDFKKSILIVKRTTVSTNRVKENTVRLKGASITRWGRVSESAGITLAL